MDCSTDALINASRCQYSCIPAGMLRAIRSYLLCQWANKQSGCTVAPNKATTPNPSNAATGVTPYSPTLSWVNGGGATSYNVYVDSGAGLVLVSAGQVGTTYGLGVLGGTTVYHWRIDAINACGTTTGDVWTFTTGEIFTLAPDHVFSWTNSSGNHIGLLATFRSDPNVLSTTQIFCDSAGLNSVSGMNSLPTLTIFDASSNNITAFNFTGCNALVYCKIDNNGPATTVTGLSGNTSLQTLIADVNGTPTLNLSGCTALVSASISSNAFDDGTGGLNLTGCTILQTLNVGGNSGSITLDLHTCTNLQNLFAGACGLNSINLTNCTNLISADLGSTNLSSVNLTDQVNMTDLTISNNPLTGLDVSTCVNLINLDCQACPLLGSVGPTNIVGLNNTIIATLYCNDCSLIDNIDISSLTGITGFNCFNCALSGAALTLPASGGGGSGTSIDASGNSGLTSVNLNGIDIFTVSFANCGLVTASGGVWGSNFSGADFSTNALNVASVNALLSAMASAPPALGVALITFEFGTNAPPSACTDVNTLRTNGYTVNVNGPC